MHIVLQWSDAHHCGDVRVAVEQSSDGITVGVFMKPIGGRGWEVVVEQGIGRWAGRAVGASVRVGR